MYNNFIFPFSASVPCRLASILFNKYLNTALFLIEVYSPCSFLPDLVCLHLLWMLGHSSVPHLSVPGGRINKLGLEQSLH